MRSTATLARLALIALGSCLLAAGSAHAQAAPAGAVPPGWAWQGVWQDGRWAGQWVPGPGVAPGAPMPGAWQQPPAPMPYPAQADTARMGQGCHHDRDDDTGRDHGGWHRHTHACTPMADDRAQPAPAYPPMAYGPMPYPPMAYAPMGYMMVPVMTAPQAPCVETRTVTTEYIIDRRHRVYRPAPHHKDKRVYTGS